MTRKMWTVGGSLALIAVMGAAMAVSRHTVTAQASRQPVPQFEPDPLWSQALPNRWATGQVGGIAVDSHDHVWIFIVPRRFRRANGARR